MKRKRERREGQLPEGYSFRQREIQSYKNRVRREDQEDFMTTVHKYGFQNDWDVIDENGEIVLRVSGNQRQRAIDLLRRQ